MGESKTSTGRPAPGGTTATAVVPGPHPTTTTSFGGPPGPTTTTTPAGGCPDARGCPNYKLHAGRWPRDADGTATIHYRIKTDGHTPVNSAPITPEQLIAAVRGAAQTWMDAVPSVRLVYDGTTTEAPNSSNNVIGWGTTTTIIPGGAETRYTPGPDGPTYTGFSVYLYPTEGLTYRPCDPAHGQPCDDGPNDNLDLGGLLTHEWGHVLGLDHVESQQTDNELTMYPGGGNANERHKATLGLGDILGARNLYPTNAALPPIYRP
jgi:hypothetical protein